MSTVFEIARQLKAPGVQTTATFNPSRLSPRLRKMTKDSIVSGYHKGGWSSQTKHTRHLVFNLAGELPVTYATQDGNYMTLSISRNITDDTMAQIVGLLESDCALRKMAYEEPTNRYQPDRASFYQEVDARLKMNVEVLRTASTNKRSPYLIVRNSKIRDQLAQAFLKDRTVEEIAIAQRIARVLDREMDFPIPLSYNF